MKEQIGILAAQVGGSRVDVQLDTHKKLPVRTSHQIAYRDDVKPGTSVEGNGGHAPEALIPMGENRIVEHDESMKDF